MARNCKGRIYGPAGKQFDLPTFEGKGSSWRIQSGNYRDITAKNSTEDLEESTIIKCYPNPGFELDLEVVCGIDDEVPCIGDLCEKVTFNGETFAMTVEDVGFPLAARKGLVLSITLQHLCSVDYDQYAEWDVSPAA